MDFSSFPCSLPMIPSFRPFFLRRCCLQQSVSFERFEEHCFSGAPNWDRMANSTYDNMWQQAMGELSEQLHVEGVDDGEDGEGGGGEVGPDLFCQHFTYFLPADQSFPLSRALRT